MQKAHKIAVVRVRGNVRMDKHVDATLKMLRLMRPNYCIVVDSNPNIEGMIKKSKDYVTYGPIDEETLKALKEARGETTIDHDGKKVDKKFFRLNPPKKGYGRNGIKKQFSLGGALGDRKEKINELIRRML